MSVGPTPSRRCRLQRTFSTSVANDRSAPARLRDLKMTNSDVTRRELLELAVATGGALAGGQFIAGTGSPAAAQAAGAAPAPLDTMLRVNGTRPRLWPDPSTPLPGPMR